ncbi:MAG: molybdate ABC transporter substrate-binding protein [Rhodobacteraceae bacterium]|nr:molybdate ABC transporter substrate-binding protein [Paracoccaceae bacterium]
MRFNRRQMMLAALAGMAPWPGRAQSAEVLVAVAANFMNVAEQLVLQFEAETGVRVVLAGGSTGQFFAQITNGAPYDILLSADQDRPAKLEDAGFGTGRFSYARGLLSLWRPGEGEVGEQDLRVENPGYIAIANPKLAPYGAAAQQVLEGLGLWESLQGRIVMGQNIAQAYALVASGNATLGLVARSYALGQGVRWDMPERLYAPILQDAILLNQREEAAAFMAFLASEPAQKTIRAAGYGAL